ncbi:MAG: segregation/condensation protein A, partial [Candidatus Obscuribacterales bacterium]|nr:segregation/condensation protein A [Candidatus Obscuribacterales bacterium]
NAPREPRQITIADLEKALVRKSQRRKVRKRQVTLEELIEALREAEKIEKSRADKKPKERISMAGYMQVNDVADILDLAHDEDIESTIDRVEQILAEILKIGEKLELFSLVTLLEQNSDWVDAFLASLFLSNAGKIDLEQEEFYGPLYLTLCKQKAVSDTVVSS